jgi:hypothetical protein
MKYWEFISDQNWFSLTLPENWSEYDDDDDNFAFFNTEKWSGNLRITHFRSAGIQDSSYSSLANIQKKVENNPRATLVKLGNFDAAYYFKDTEDGNIIYFWETGAADDLFVCSFTFSKSFLEADWHNNEVIVVGQILSSLKVIL